MEITCPCPHCHAWTSTKSLSTSCPKCAKPLFENVSDELRDGSALTQCAACGCTHLYRQKDFNRKIGIGILVVGVLLAYFTYGISLLAVTVLDFVIYRRVGEVGCCYDCGAQYRQSPLIAALDPFSLILHDHYRNRKKS